MGLVESLVEQKTGCRGLVQQAQPSDMEKRFTVCLETSLPPPFVVILGPRQERHPTTTDYPREPV